MEIFEDAAPDLGNNPEFTVSELSGAVKRVIEGEFGRVRVRGEIGRVSRPASGHLYYDLKDDRAVLAAITWRGQTSHLTVQPEEGMEVIATGRLTTFPGQSKYQLIIEDLAPAGEGALMAMLEKRRRALLAEGLFDQARKRPIPFLPRVIGVVTSPSGAVIRDILHRLNDRFPCHVLLWPAAVQGERCAPEIAAGIEGFNALPADGPIPRPDVIIVARGGGSLEDLWGFNEEIVVRAAAASRIPLISAVGHETDTTLIDHAADLRAPTPTAAAELAVPVRLELLANVDQLSARLLRAVSSAGGARQQRLRDLVRALPRPESLTMAAAQSLDHQAERLAAVMSHAFDKRRATFARLSDQMRPALLTMGFERRRYALRHEEERLAHQFAARMQMLQTGFGNFASRLEPALHRLIADNRRKIIEGRAQMQNLHARLEVAVSRRLHLLDDRLRAADRMRQNLGYHETLRRGFAVIRGGGHVVTNLAAAESLPALEIEFQDGRLNVDTHQGARRHPRRAADDASGNDQGSLF